DASAVAGLDWNQRIVPWGEICGAFPPLGGAAPMVGNDYDLRQVYPGVIRVVPLAGPRCSRHLPRMVVSGGVRAARAVASGVGLLVFLTASWSEARALDPCPHHDALAVAMEGMAGMQDMPGMAGMMAGQHGHTDPSGHPEHHGPCKCMGCCCGAGTT